MDERYYALIVAGGRGERFWPLSTSHRPKQFLELISDRPLIADSVTRLRGLIPPERTFVITSAPMVEVAREALDDFPPENVIGEPKGRDTAAAIALGCALIRKRNPDAVFCVLTADHVIGKLELFRKTLQCSLQLAAENDILVTIGITPTEPNTGYGYIESGSIFKKHGGITFFQAKRFVEKPDRKSAKKFIESQKFYWNSGMFIWSIAALRNALAHYHPAMVKMMNQVEPAIGTDDFDKVVMREYDQLERIPIDYALMEKADNIIMAQGLFEWDDVGSWNSLANHFNADESNNVGIGLLESLDSTQNIVYSKNRVTALVGVQDLVVVQGEGVTLVCHRDNAQDIKALVRQLKKSRNYDELL